MPFHEVSLKEGTGQNGNLAAITADAQKSISRLHEDFENKMSDDLNTSPLLTGVFQEALKFINGSLVMLKVWSSHYVAADTFLCIYGD